MPTLPKPVPLTIDHAAFFAAYRQHFPTPNNILSQHTVDGLDALLTNFGRDSRWYDPRHVAYALATIRTETGVSIKGINQMYHPIEELGGQIYLSKYYLNPRLKRMLGNVMLADSWNFKGRGYVQITGRRNYTLFADLLHVDLVGNPQLATDPVIAFEIMTEGMHGGLFTGRSLSDYIYTRTPSVGLLDVHTDYVHARQIINGMDRARIISYDAQKFEKCLRLATT
jgi:hypothetical protein